MLTCYFDEAGGVDHGFTVVAGYVATVEQWENFEVDWKLSLISYKVPYLHMAKLAHFKGPYAKWENSPIFRARFLLEMSQIIQQHVKRGFACFIEHAAFAQADSEYELHETFGSPYALAGMSSVARVTAWRRKTVPPSVPVEYVFEDGAPDKCGLMKMMEKDKYPTPIFRPGRDIDSRKSGLRHGFVQLQAADYLAYEIRKFVSDHSKYKTMERAPRASLGALTGVEIDKYFMGYERLVRMSQQLRLKRRTKEKEK